MSDYKKTLHLPTTSFPMKANLTQKEPEMLAFWNKIDAYKAMTESNTAQGSYVLHDGPPYANGHIHLGTALNKILKDIILKSHNMLGYKAEYVPGWDCHGLPIEFKVEQELAAKNKKDLPAPVIRKLCRSYAEQWIDVQRKEFKRLGIFGTWDDPYLSMKPSYEAATARELGRVMEKGSLTRSKKPIHWCCTCKTALAEAEVEYADHSSPSLYVRFPLPDKKLHELFPEAKGTENYVVIWTTTPWTLPDNLAVAVHPEFEYCLVSHAGAQYLLACDLVEHCAEAFGWTDYTVHGKQLGKNIEGLVAQHPFYERPSPLVLGEHVTLEAGTGCVHTAPGHGREDYETGLAYKLEILSPLDDSGRFLDTVPFFAGMTVFEANPKVIEKLKEVGHLLTSKNISHSYPHCWRCKEPVIFRATTQWFISMDKNDLRENALDAIRSKVEWIPAWGEERIYSMIENRPDWCISRQRIWGVPIVALLCEACGAAWHDPAWVLDIAERFAAHPTGCDYWFEKDIDSIAPAGLSCPSCQASRWKKETDILDVWFDSGTSFAAVLELRPECTFPADLYLEGSDQHRGWFHSSLLASMATRGVPPYKAVLTHGYVVDGEGKKMSKSIGNVVAPHEIIDKFGAEILRMWVSSVEYREDVRISDEILNRLVDAYRRIRNTCRYLLGNLSGFTPDKALPFSELDPLDAYALDVVSAAHERIQKAYADFEFHKVFHTLHNICVTDLSAFYFDVLKDRLYSEGANSKERRSAQTALWHILQLLVYDMAPILSFTAEEIFQHIDKALVQDVPTVFALTAAKLQTHSITTKERAAWERLLAVKDAVTQAIEPLRRDKVIGHSLDTQVCLYCAPELLQLLDDLNTDLRPLFIVSQLRLLPLRDAPNDAPMAQEMDNTLAISVAKAEGEKCERCWVYSTDLGTVAVYPSLCPRCTAVLQAK